MNKFIYNIKHEAISLLLVFLSCSCTGIHPASSSSTGVPVAQGDTSTFVVRRAIGGEELCPFPSNVTYSQICREIGEQKGVNPLFIQLISGSEAVKNAETSQERPTGDLSYAVLTSRAIDQDKRKELRGYRFKFRT